jgi:HlyD family secretion protein
MTEGTHPTETAHFQVSSPAAPPDQKQGQVPDAGQEQPSDQGKTPEKGKFRLRPPRHWPYWLLGLGAVGLVYLAFRPKPTAVDLVTVEQGNLQVTVDAEGKTRVQDRFVVAAPVDGRVARVDLEAGDQVESGAVVAQIDPLPLTSQVQQVQARLRELEAQITGVDTLRPKQAALARARSRIQAAQAAKRTAAARLAEAEASLQQAQRESQRADQLASQGAISEQQRESAALAETSRRQEREAAKQALEGATAEVEAAQKDYAILEAEQEDPDYLVDVYQAQMANAEAELTRLADQARRTDITSPVGGQVLGIHEKSERFVAAGTPLLDIGNPDQLELVIDVLSSDAVKVQPGDTILVDQWGGDETLMAKVSYIEPSAFTKVSALGVEEQRVNVIGNFIENAPLGDGFRVDTQIVIEDLPDVLKVPVSALFPCEEQTCVFVVEEDWAQQTEVAVGQRNTFEAAVTDGLQAGDVVIAFPNSVEEGDPVKARSAN